MQYEIRDIISIFISGSVKRWIYLERWNRDWERITSVIIEESLLKPMLIISRRIWIILELICLIVKREQKWKKLKDEKKSRSKGGFLEIVLCNLTKMNKIFFEGVKAWSVEDVFVWFVLQR